MIFKPVVGHSGYFVTDTGRVFSTKGGFHEIKQQVHKVSGYHHFSAWDGHKASTVKVHLAVATAFHGARPDGLACSHLDGTRDNNAANNLKWVTPKENNYHKRTHGTYLLGSAVGTAKLKEAQIPIIRSMIKQAVAVEEIAEKFKVNPRTIQDIQRGATWSHI